MDKSELRVLISDNNSSIEDDDFIDCDEVIELIEQKEGIIFECVDDDIL